MIRIVKRVIRGNVIGAVRKARLGKIARQKFGNGVDVQEIAFAL